MQDKKQELQIGKTKDKPKKRCRAIRITDYTSHPENKIQFEIIYRKPRSTQFRIHNKNEIFAITLFVNVIRRLCSVAINK